MRKIKVVVVLSIAEVEYMEITQASKEDALL